MLSVPVELMGSSFIGVNLWSALMDSDLMGWLCIIILAIFSVYTWQVIFLKYRELRCTEKQNAEFRRLTSLHGQLERAFAESDNFPESPRASVLRAAYYEIHANSALSEHSSLSLEHKLESVRWTVERALDRAVNDEAARLEERMSVLALMTSLCPFIGLFGTVWGVLGAFQALTISGAANLQALAPGISTALLTTIGGLLVAIPASVAYSAFAAMIQSLVADMESYSLDLSNVFQREALRRQSLAEAAA
jgi:biopolymer transport protein TolQ